MSEMHLRQPGFMCSACGAFTKTNKEYKSLKKQGIQDIFIKTNQLKLAFNMAWFIEVLNIYLEELLLIKY